MLNNFTDDQLMEELERRKRAAMPKAIPREDMDTRGVLSACNGYIDMLADEGYSDEDTVHDIFEAAMEMVYGKQVWEWVRSNQG